MLRVSRLSKRKNVLRNYDGYYVRLSSVYTKNPYNILGIKSNATKADIKKAYIEKAKKCHPDLFPDNEQKTKEFQELQEAYTTLSDTKKRAQYSQQSSAHKPPQYPRHPYNTEYRQNPSPRGSQWGSNDPLLRMFEEMRRQQEYNKRTYGSYNESSEKKRVNWTTIFIRAVFIYFVITLIFGNLRLQSHRAQDPDFQHLSEAERDALAEQLARAERRMTPGEREMYNRQREVRELMEKYYVKDDSKDDTMDKVDRNS